MMVQNRLFMSKRQVAISIVIALCGIFHAMQAIGQFTEIKDSLGRTRYVYLAHNDTVKAESQEWHALHYHTVSYEIRDKIIQKLIHGKADDIFTDSFNNFSRLIFKNDWAHSFNVPTPPLSHIYILESKGVIVCLSDYNIAGYYILLYSLADGKLLYKRQYNMMELKANKNQLRDLINKYPGIKDCLAQGPNVTKDHGDYYIELTSCMTHTIGNYDSLQKLNITVADRYFPGAMAIIDDEIRGDYVTRRSLFDRSDPIYDLIMIGAVPYVLILNNTHGEKVNIPLISNCDIMREIE